MGSGGQPSVAHDFEEPFNDSVEFFGRDAAKLLAESFGCESTNLADFDPRLLGKLGALDLERQGKPRPLRLARDGTGDLGCKSTRSIFWQRCVCRNG